MRSEFKLLVGSVHRRLFVFFKDFISFFFCFEIMHISNGNFYSQELDVHIKNIEEKFGELSPATAKITIDPKNVEKQRMAMFPRAFNRSEDDQRVASNKAQLNFNTIGESSSNAATSNDTPSNDELNESRMQEGGLDHSRRGRLGQKRQADGIHPLRDNEKSSSTKKIATNCDNVTSTTK